MINVMMHFEGIDVLARMVVYADGRRHFSVDIQECLGGKAETKIMNDQQLGAMLALMIGGDAGFSSQTARELYAVAEPVLPKDMELRLIP